VSTIFVYTVSVKNVTLSVDGSVLERARELARRRSTTLNQMFRDWLIELTAEPARRDRYEQLMARLEHVRSGGRFTRDEMNAR
jgi:glycine cleavage system H lipoate-binding protein